MHRQDFPDFTDVLSQLRSLDQTADAQYGNVQSGQSYFHKKTLTSVTVKQDNKESSLSVAVLKPKGNLAYKDSTRQRNSRILEIIRNKYRELRKKPSPFLQRALAHGASGKITQLESGDLEQLLKTDKDKVVRDCKEMIAQLVLAIYELHEVLQLVHRDIKPGNILFTVLSEGRLYLQLTDFEFSGKPEDKDLPWGTAEYSGAPELADLVEDVYDRGRIIGKGWKVKEITRQDKRFKEADKKALDCFALGKVIEKIWEKYNFIAKYGDPDFKAIKNLYKSLLKPISERDDDLSAKNDSTSKLQWENDNEETGSAEDDEDFVEVDEKKSEEESTDDNITDDTDDYLVSTKRPTIKEVMNHPLFGRTSKERAAYFEKVKKEFDRPDTYLGDFYFHEFSPDENDNFYLLPTPLQHIYLAANAMNDVSIKEAGDEPLIYQSMYEKAKNLLYQIDSLSPELNTKQLAPILKTLTQKAKEVIIIARKNAEDAIHNNELNNIKNMTNEQLKIAVQRAYDRYIALNFSKPKSTWEKFWSSHGETGRVNASEFKKNFDKLTLNPWAYGPNELFKVITDHFEFRAGARGQTSFKTLLSKELGVISSLPLNIWVETLNPKLSSDDLLGNRRKKK